MPGPSKKDYQRLLDRISGIFGEMLETAQDQVQGQGRRPYRSAKDICTAKFACANRKNPGGTDAVPIRAHDGTLDFRTAWETRPESYAKTKEKVAQVKERSAQARRDRRAGMEGQRAEQSIFSTGRTTWACAWRPPAAATAIVMNVSSA